MFDAPLSFLRETDPIVLFFILKGLLTLLIGVPLQMLLFLFYDWLRESLYARAAKHRPPTNSGN